MRTVHRWTRFTARGVAAGLLLTAIVSSKALAQVQVSGVVYAQYSYNTASDTAARDTNLAGQATGRVNNFDVTRAYLNVMARFTGGFVTRVTTDVFNSAGSRVVRLKYAYVNWTPEGSPVTYRLGLIHTPWIDFEEQLWDYRMEGPTVLDSRPIGGGYLSSADYGAAVEGSFNHDAVNFLGGIYDGENYNGGPADANKDLMGRVTVRLLNTDDMSRVGGLRVTGYAQYGQPTSGGERQRFVGMVSYRSHMLTLAGIYGATKDSTTGSPATNAVLGAVGAKPEAKGTVMSVFGVLKFSNSPLAVVGRFDSVDPSSSVSGDKFTRVIAGVSYQLSANVRLLADVDQQSFESGFSPSAAQYTGYLGRSTVNLHSQFTF